MNRVLLAMGLGLMVFLTAWACSPSVSPVGCAPETCDGCCDAEGYCVRTGDQPSACGEGGAACVVCPEATTCEVTRCVGTTTCATNGQTCSEGAACCSLRCEEGQCAAQPTGGDAGVTGDDAGVTGDDAGVTGDDAGVTGDDAGVTDDDAGVTGGDAGVTGADAGTSGDDAGTLSDGGLDGGLFMCRGNSAACTVDAQCCSDSCDPSGACAFAPSDGGLCTPDGQACAASAECCSLSCNANTGLCGAGNTCRLNNQPCSQPAQCCSLFCGASGSCATAPDAGTCSSQGTPCTQGLECCSFVCNPGSRRCM